MERHTMWSKNCHRKEAYLRLRSRKEKRSIEVSRKGDNTVETSAKTSIDLSASVYIRKGLARIVNDVDETRWWNTKRSVARLSLFERFLLRRAVYATPGGVAGGRVSLHVREFIKHSFEPFRARRNGFPGNFHPRTLGWQWKEIECTT